MKGLDGAYLEIHIEGVSGTSFDWESVMAVLGSINDD
jgi:hypothetical protein